jgi:hypothetical protein
MKLEETKEAKSITTSQVKKLLLRVYKRYQNGAISEAQAGREAQLLNYLLKATALKGDQQEELCTVILPKPLWKNEKED